MRILLVDDDDDIRESLARFLTSEGYEVLTASNLPAGRRLLEDASPSLLITDVRVDGYNGLNLVALMSVPIPAIVLTGFPDAAIEGEARRLGAEFRLKPVAPSELSRLVAKMLDRPGIVRPA